MSEATRVAGLPATASASAAGDQSLGALVNSAVADVRRLIKMEKELAVAEVGQAGKRLAPAIAGFAVAAAAGVFVLLIGSMALAFTLADELSIVWGFTIVTGVWLLLLIVGALVGLRAVKKIKGPERTIRTVKDTADWARHPTTNTTATADAH